MEINFDRAGMAGDTELASNSEGEHSAPRPSAAASGGGGSCHATAEAVYPPTSVPESPDAVDESPLIFFSMDDARKLVAERNRLLRQYEEANRKVEALAVLVPEHMRERVFGSVLPAALLDTPGGGGANAPDTIVKEFIVDMLDTNLEAFDQEQVEEQVWSEPKFSDRTVYTPVIIAKALDRAARNGQIRKRGSVYHSRRASPHIDGVTLIGAVEDVLREATDTLEPWEIVERIEGNAALASKINIRKGAIYNALSRLVDRRIAYRDSTGAYSIAST